MATLNRCYDLKQLELLLCLPHDSSSKLPATEKNRENVTGFNFHSVNKEPKCKYDEHWQNSNFFYLSFFFLLFYWRHKILLVFPHFCCVSSCPYSAEAQEVSTHCIEAVDVFEIFMALSAISMASFISIFLYNDTMLDLGWCSRIKIFFKYLLSNFLNLQKRCLSQNVKEKKEIWFYFCGTSWSSFKCIHI